MINRTANCACGQLSILCRGDPTFVALCHCQHCQRRTGSVFAVNAVFPKSETTSSGVASEFTRTGDSGRSVTFHFCPKCGTSVFWDLEARADSYGVAVGAFADPTFGPPARAVWAENMHEWAVPQASIPAFQKGAAAAAPKAGKPG
ncbi:GFA family protein [Variovorax sp. J22R115]|uniref:GFA family protein n=1 Tax=Variovorax sp. J22R115 TaxID=3053509 RepID=UPI0034DE5F43